MTVNESTAEATKVHYKFDARQCGRCLGKGRILGFSHVQGGVCFSCGGSGNHLTANGKRARVAYFTAIEYPVTDLAVGARIREDVYVFTAGGDLHTRRVTGTVESIEESEDGPWLLVKTEHQTSHLIPNYNTITPALTKAESQEILRSMAEKFKGIVAQEVS